MQTGCHSSDRLIKALNVNLLSILFGEIVYCRWWRYFKRWLYKWQMCLHDTSSCAQYTPSHWLCSFHSISCHSLNRVSQKSIYNIYIEFWTPILWNFLCCCFYFVRGRRINVRKSTVLYLWICMYVLASVLACVQRSATLFFVWWWCRFICLYEELSLQTAPAVKFCLADVFKNSWHPSQRTLWVTLSEKSFKKQSLKFPSHLPRPLQHHSHNDLNRFFSSKAVYHKWLPPVGDRKSLWPWLTRLSAGHFCRLSKRCLSTAKHVWCAYLVH